MKRQNLSTTCVRGTGNVTQCKFRLKRNSAEYLVMFFSDILLFYLIPARRRTINSVKSHFSSKSRQPHPEQLCGSNFIKFVISDLNFPTDHCGLLLFLEFYTGSANRIQPEVSLELISG